MRLAMRCALGCGLAGMAGLAGLSAGLTAFNCLKTAFQKWFCYNTTQCIQLWKQLTQVVVSEIQAFRPVASELSLQVTHLSERLRDLHGAILTQTDKCDKRLHDLHEEVRHVRVCITTLPASRSSRAQPGHPPSRSPWASWPLDHGSETSTIALAKPQPRSVKAPPEHLPPMQPQPQSVAKPQPVAKPSPPQPQPQPEIVQSGPQWL